MPPDKPLDKTYQVDVPEIGSFTFRRRSILLQAKIENSALHSLGGPAHDENLRSVVLAIHTLADLTVIAPDGWDIDALDPLETEDVAKLWQVHGALRAAEEKFRKRAAP